MIKLLHSDNENVTVLVTVKAIDVSGSVELEKKLLEIVAENRNKDLIIDLAQVEYFSSAALSTLIITEQKLAQKHQKIGLKNASPFIQKVLRLANIDDLFVIH